MTDLYELQIVACTREGSDGTLFRVEYRFPDQPSIDTIKALRDEAAQHYVELYGEDPEITQVVVMRLTSQDIAYQTGTAAAVYGDKR